MDLTDQVWRRAADPAVDEGCKVTMKELGLPEDTPIDVWRGEGKGYPGREWLNIWFPRFSGFTIKRMFGPEIHEFWVATSVARFSVFWPEENFRSFLARMKARKFNMAHVFSGHRPVFTEWRLDLKISEGMTAAEIGKYLEGRRPKEIFNGGALSNDVTGFSADRGSGQYVDSMWEELDPPRIRRAKDLAMMQGLVRRLGPTGARRMLAKVTGGSR